MVVFLNLFFMKMDPFCFLFFKIYLRTKCSFGMSLYILVISSAQLISFTYVLYLKLQRGLDVKINVSRDTDRGLLLEKDFSFLP